MDINVKYEIKGVEGLIIDQADQVWRLPFKSANNKQFPAKKLAPVYERNYTGYRFKNKIYSERFIFRNRIERPQVINIPDPDISPGKTGESQ